MTAERISEIEKMLAGYDAWRERWFNHSGCRATIRPGEVALRELLAEVKAALAPAPSSTIQGGNESAG